MQKKNLNYAKKQSQVYKGLWPEMFPHLYDPVSSLQSPVLSSRTVLQDVLDENAPHHLSIAQPAAHPSAPNDADTQWSARLSEELHSEVGTDISMLDSDILRFKAVTFDNWWLWLLIWYCKSALSFIVRWTENVLPSNCCGHVSQT